MKTIFSWVAAIAALAGAYFFFAAGQKKSSELASLRAVVGEAEQVRDENDSLKKRKDEAAEIVRLKKENEEVTKLRSEVGQLREEKLGLSNQIQTAQADIEAVRAKVTATPNAPAQLPPLPAPGSVEELTSMHQVGVCLIMFASDHAGLFPTNFTDTTDYLKSLSFTDSTGSKSSSFNIKVLEQFELLPMTQKWNEIQQPSSTVLARGKFTDANGRRTYVFADGHAEIRKDEK